MGEIHILDSVTVDKIAAGEVVERPSSVVKELVENSIDAGARMITVEIKDGGISMIRITDDGCGIDKSQIEKAFMRHATSKIEKSEDLAYVTSLGFRGEALSSICAVCQVEMITKTKEDFTGIRVNCNGGVLQTPTEVGAPDGTTIIVRNIFYNTPVRQKFLKSKTTEGTYISDLMQHLALSKPHISFKFIQNGQTRFYTSGNGNVKEIIYRIYGKDVSENMIYMKKEMEGLSLEAYLGKPVLNRATRAFETIFVNGRYIKSNLLSSVLEEGYKNHLMQHKFPFAILYFDIDTEKIDVNVHPTKMDIRIQEPDSFFTTIRDWVKDALLEKDLIPEVVLTESKQQQKEETERQRLLTKIVPEPFEKKRNEENLIRETGNYGVQDTKTENHLPNILKKPVFEKLTRDEVKNKEIKSGSINGSELENVASDEDYFFEEHVQVRPTTIGTAAQNGRHTTTDGESDFPNISAGDKGSYYNDENDDGDLKNTGQVIPSDTATQMQDSNNMSQSGELKASIVSNVSVNCQDDEQITQTQRLQQETNNRPNESTKGFAPEITAAEVTNSSRIINAKDANTSSSSTILKQDEFIFVEKPEQMELSFDKFFEESSREKYRILGQIFDTYWLITCEDKLFIMDQHAAHEKVMYEKFVKQMEEHTLETQQLNPPVILTMTLAERQIYLDYQEHFDTLGFVLEEFGGNEYALREVPLNLYGYNEKELFLSILDSLMESNIRSNKKLILEKIASMSCKAAVKGNQSISFAEAQELVDTLFTLENPYNCPHGRPTVISMSKYEIEKKFKRIV